MNKPGPSRKLSHLDEFLLVLMRLKAGLFVQDREDRFGISISLVSHICITWINLLYLELNDIFPFPSQELVRKNMPQEFAEYPTTRIIWDCSKIFIQRPSAMLVQSETWSEYKHHNTWKVLVGITPNGQVSYLSHLWGGRVSDKQITRESGVLDLLDAGDKVMVDRGFDISNIVPDGVTVNMPPFLAGRDQMTAAKTGNHEYCFCLHTRRTCNWENENIPHIRWHTSEHIKPICYADSHSLWFIDKLPSSIIKTCWPLGIFFLHCRWKYLIMILGKFIFHFYFLTICYNLSPK